MKSKYKNLAERFGDGVMLLVGDYVTFTDGSGFLVGDATPYHEPSKNDGGFGWYWDGALCRKPLSSVINILDKVQENE
jgi:hypothetical protein